MSMHGAVLAVPYASPFLTQGTYMGVSLHTSDATGSGCVSSLDLLSASGLVNYFGKWTDLTRVEISPLLMQKGATRLAFYGLSHLKDERLARLFGDHCVSVIGPLLFSVELSRT
jgi:hypothetical protein